MSYRVTLLSIMRHIIIFSKLRMGKRNFIIKVDHTKPIHKREISVTPLNGRVIIIRGNKYIKKSMKRKTNGCYNNRINNINVNKCLSALCIFDLGNVGQ